jgi:transposase
MDKRQQKGMEIAKSKTIKPTKDGWLVKSQSSDNCYKVDEEFVCNCPDAECRGVTCKHAYAVRYFLQIERDTANGIETDKVRISYKQAWAAYTDAQCAEVKMFDKLLKDLVESVEEPEQVNRRRPRVPLKEQTFCAIQKVYSQLSSRRARSLFVNAAERQQIGKAPCYNMVNLALNRKDLTPVLHELLAISASPLKGVEVDFAIDSSGFRTSSFNSYATEKYTLKRSHKWLKAHIMTGVKTNVVTSIEVTDEDGADSPQLKPLVMATTNAGFTTHEVSADKAYSSRGNYEVVRQAGGQAYIPFRSNAKGRSKGSMLWHKMFHYFQMNQEEFLQHYHKRSNVESTFAAIKKKFGETLKSKNRVAQENELLCKFIAYNLTVVIHEMFELGIKAEFEDKSAYPL